MRIEIDQSSKIEYTSKDTVVAFSNGKQKALLIRASDKRKIQKIFREAGKPDMFIYKTFAILVYLLIRKDIKDIQEIVVDKEYSGKEYLIKHLLLQILRGQKKVFDKENIYFKQIGKKSKAHEKAINTFQGKIKPDTVVGFKEILPFIVG